MIVHRLGILASHPIQYQAPWFRALAKIMDIHVFFAHRQTPAQQAEAGFGVAFDWDIDLLSGYHYTFLENRANSPNVNRFFGCNTPEIAHYIKAKKFDIFLVNGWYLKSYWQAIRTCHRIGIPVLVRGDSQLYTSRSKLKRCTKEIVYRIILRQFDGFLVVGQRTREYLLHYGVKPEQMYDVPHFVDNEWFREKSRMTMVERRTFRDKLGVGDKAALILFVGKFIPKKRPLDLVYALSLLKKSGVSAEAIFVGAGELEEKIRQLSRDLGIIVRLPGFKNQSELPYYYAAADLLVLPSDGETWGLVVNEAMACGLPTIVSDAVGCGPNLIEEGKTGFTYPVGDINSLYRRIEQLITMIKSGYDFHPALRQKMDVYSLEAAVEGTVETVSTLVRVP